MRKKIFLLISFLLFTYIFAQNIPEEIRNTLEESGLYSFTKEDSIKEDKPLVELICKTKEQFLKETCLPWIKKDLFKDYRNITYEEIIITYKDGKYIYDTPKNSFHKYMWKKANNKEYSIVYSLNTTYPISGLGNYVIRVFGTNYVNIITLSYPKLIDEEYKEFDSLNDIFIFKKGQKLNLNKGIAQTQGYYCKNEEAAEIFYERLIKKDDSLPEFVIRFQDAEMFLEKIIEKY